MTRKIEFFLICLNILGCCTNLYSESFVVKKKSKKSTSLKKCREHCCQNSVDMLHECPSISRSIADIQEIEMDMVHGYLESNKKSLLHTLSKEELKELETLQNKVYSAAKNFNSAMQGYTARVRSMTRKK